MTGDSFELLEIHHYTVFEAITSTLNVSYESILFEQNVPFEQVCDLTCVYTILCTQIFV